MLNRLLFIVLLAVAIILHAADPSGTRKGDVARTIHQKLDEIRSVKDFGAVCDDSTDDTTAIQTAIDSMGDTSIERRSGMRLLVSGPCVITRTITIRRKSFILQGEGWGYRGDPSPRRSYIRWNGSAGSSMIQIQDAFGGLVIRDLKLIGKTTARPLAAIELNETNDGTPTTSITIENIQIGGDSRETDPGIQFTNGILWSGIFANNSEIALRRLLITGCSEYGIKQSSTQNVNLSGYDLSISQCGTGIRVTGALTGFGLNMSRNNVDIEIPTLDDNSRHVNAYATIHGYFSELAGRLAILKGGRLTIIGGQYQINTTTHTDGRIVDATGNVAAELTLRSFRFFQSRSAPTPPFLDFSNASSVAGSKSIILDGIIGWRNLKGGANGMDVTTGNVTDRRYVYFREEQQGPGFALPRVAQNLIASTGSQWAIDRYDIPGIAYDVASPARITADQNNYDPSRSTVWRLSSAASRKITGIGGGWQGRKIMIANVGAQNIVIQNQNIGSSEPNRIITGTGHDITIAADSTAVLIYDSTSARWRLFGTR